MEATFKINESELDSTFLKRLKTLFRNRTFIIGVEDASNENNTKYLSKLTEAMEDVEAGRNLIAFTGDEYLKMIENVSKK